MELTIFELIASILVDGGVDVWKKEGRRNEGEEIWGDEE